MFKELIDRIVGLADSARKPTVLSLGADPREVAVAMPDGSITRFPVLPAAHKEELWTHRELGRFITEQMEAEKSVVYISVDAVIALYDKNDRRDRATCDLELSEQWRRLVAFATTRQELGQRDFYRLLRIAFAGAGSQVDDLQERVKRITWQAGDSGASQVGHGTAAISKSLIAEVLGESPIPERVNVTVPLWNGIDQRVTVACAVEVLPECKSFALTPLPGEISRCEEEALAWLMEDVDNLVPSGVEVYLGKP